MVRIEMWSGRHAVEMVGIKMRSETKCGENELRGWAEGMVGTETRSETECGENGRDRNAVRDKTQGCGLVRNGTGGV